MCLNLDLLDELRIGVEQRLASYQNLMARHYNKQAKPKHLNIGELVLRRVTLATKDSAQGKLAQIGKDLTRLLIASGEILTIKGNLTGKSYLTLGTLSIGGSTTSGSLPITMFTFTLNAFPFHILLISIMF